MQFDAGIVGREAPVDRGTLRIALDHPRRHLGFQEGPIRYTSVHALTTAKGTRTQLDLRHVQPTTVLRGVVNFQLAYQPSGLCGREALVQRAGVCVLRLSMMSTMRSASG